MSELTALRLRQLVHYDASTGVFTRAMEHASPQHRARWPVGQVMGYGHRDGSRRLDVTRDRRKTKPFVARIRYCDTNLYLGSFETAEAAHAFYLKAKRVLHPGFVN